MPPSLTSAGPVRIHRDNWGNAHVVADVTPPGYGGAFRVSLAGALQVRVGPGTCEGITARLDGVPLDGMDDGRTVRVPPLKLKEGPDADLRSWVMLRFVVDLATGLPVEDDEDTATIVHRNDLSAVFANGVSPDDGTGAGHLPLAMLVWRNERSVQRVVRNVYFQQRHSFVPATKDRRAFHLFSPAA